LQNPTPEERQYCSELNRTETLWGTADTVDVWLCLEYRPVWKAKALADNELALVTREWLVKTLQSLRSAGFRVRPQFIRQPELDRHETRLLVAFEGRVFEFSGRGYGFLDDLDLLSLLEDPDRLFGAAKEPDQPVYLVCTNGQRDRCCARFGLPTYAALRERLGERVWQATHLGGHRFAPNVLVLPNACLYGRVAEESIAGFLESTEAGQVDFARLRGRTCYSPIVQAAEANLGRQGLRLLHFNGDESAAEISFADDQERFSVSMKRVEQGSVVTKSCGDGQAATVFPYLPA